MTPQITFYNVEMKRFTGCISPPPTEDKSTHILANRALFQPKRAVVYELFLKL